MNVHHSYYCDNCGHVFSTPTTSHSGFSQLRSEEDSDDKRCPRCNNPDFEQLKPEEHGTEAGPDGNHYRRYHAEEIRAVA